MSTLLHTSAGDWMYQMAKRLYPICRSITGAGVRETLAVIAEHVGLQQHDVPTGTKVFDWTVPLEWNVRSAYIDDLNGRRLVDFAEHNLHLVSYSTPLRRRVHRDELLQHLHTIPTQPDWIPYRTSYYRDDWGFCLSHRAASRLTDTEYDVEIDSSLRAGSLTYGELLLPGRSRQEVLIYSHVCHPSLANDNLSGVVVTTALASRLSTMPRRFSYRFVWGPGTIGSITWLALNRDRLREVRLGLVAVLLGDRGRLHYKQTRRGDQEIDRIAGHVVGRRHGRILPFDPYGYDERQFGSPGIQLPIGRLTRTPNGAYPEYHTSADDMAFISAEGLADSLDALLEIVDMIENNRRYVNLSPYGEPQLGRRGLYRNSGGENLPDRELAMLWTLNQSDGETPLLDIAERSGIPFSAIKRSAEDLTAAKLLQDPESPDSTSQSES